MSDIYEWGDWFKCSKEIVRDDNISKSAKWLYVVLSYLNNTYANKNGIFTRKNENLIEDTGLSHNTLNKAKKELVDNGYIETWQNSLYQDGTHTKLTTFKVCYYRLLK